MKADELPAPVKSPLKWAGGKSWLVPRLRELYAPHAHRRLVDPFCGALSVPLGLRPERVLCNDINAPLMNFWASVERGLHRPEYTDEQYTNTQEAYYIIRDRLNDYMPHFGMGRRPVAAWDFYYLNRTCFNGLCRFNKKGEFNVPYGRYKRIEYRHNFDDISKVLTGWGFVCASYEWLDVEKSSDFLYIDPPYDDGFTSYSPGGFDWQKQHHLAGWAESRGVPVVVSNRATDRILQLYKDLDFTIEVIPAPRRIACNGDRKPVMEMLAYKNL